MSSSKATNTNDNSAPLPPPPPPQINWICPACTFTNDHSTNACQICATIKPHSLDSSGLSPGD